MATTKTIELRTEIPGPRSREILERKERVVADPLSIYHNLVIERAQGATLTDVDGNTFIDFTGGVGCLNVGHSHPRVVEAAQEQLERFSHTDFTIIPYEVYVRLAERLCELTELQDRITARRRDAMVGREVDVLVDTPGVGRTHREAPEIDGIVSVPEALAPGSLARLTVTAATGPDLEAV